MKAAAIIAAAGIGKRMGGDLPKQYLELAGKPIICHTLDRFHDVDCIGEVVITVEPGREDAFTKEILTPFGYPKSWKVTAGGEVRQRSVYNGLKSISATCDVVLVHDGVRPFITNEQIRKLAEVAGDKGGCILAAPVKETIKRVRSDGVIAETVDRSVLWGAQTPQAFRLPLLMVAMEAAFEEGYMGTDEASIVERLGKEVVIVEGDGRNIKITTPEDLIMAEAILKDWK